jgi:hypothetical protein
MAANKEGNAQELIEENLKTLVQEMQWVRKLLTLHWPPATNRNTSRWSSE